MLQTWAVLGDIQIPWQDKPVLDLVLAFLRDLKPYGVILNGDVTDCYPISEFTKNPLSHVGLNREIREAAWLMSALDQMGIKDRWWLGGNHEDRLRRRAHGEGSARSDRMGLEDVRSGMGIGGDEVVEFQKCRGPG